MEWKVGRGLIYIRYEHSLEKMLARRTGIGTGLDSSVKHGEEMGAEILASVGGGAWRS